jgi:hypothetical protein
MLQFWIVDAIIMPISFTPTQCAVEIFVKQVVHIADIQRLKRALKLL